MKKKTDKEKIELIKKRLFRKYPSMYPKYEQILKRKRTLNFLDETHVTGCMKDLRFLDCVKDFMPKEHFSRNLYWGMVPNSHTLDKVDVKTLRRLLSYSRKEKIMWQKYKTRDVEKHIDIRIHDYEEYKKLPKILTIYRGCLEGDEFRPSWSRRKDLAFDWALKADEGDYEEKRIKKGNITTWVRIKGKKKAYIYKAKIHKRHIYFYTKWRGEEEIVVNTKRLINKEKLRGVKGKVDKALL